MSIAVVLERVKRDSSAPANWLLGMPAGAETVPDRLDWRLTTLRPHSFGIF
jgi:hypothetical protein